MKSWLLAPLLLACSLRAGAASPNDPVDIGAAAANVLQKLDQACKQSDVDGAELAASAAPGNRPLMIRLARDLNCTCGPEAVEIAYPAATRTGSTTFGAFLVRFSGAMNVCVARTVRRVVDEPCGRNVDPFAEGAPSSPAVAQARCQCARQELDKVAAGDPSKDADAASASYAAGTAPPREPPFIVMMKTVENSCGAVQPKKP